MYTFIKIILASFQDLKDVVNEMVAKNNNSIGHFTIDASRSDFIGNARI